MVKKESNQSDEYKREQEETLGLIKPDALKAHLVGTILKYYENEGLIIKELQLCYPSKELLMKHYAEHLGKSFLEELITFMQSGPVVAFVLSGACVVAKVREINGATNPAKALPGTIRALYGTDTQQNCVHGSAVIEDARREIQLWFPNHIK